MIRIRCWLHEERQGHGRFINVDLTKMTVADLCVAVSERFEVGDGGRGCLFADGGEILVEDVSILRDGDRVSYIPDEHQEHPYDDQPMAVVADEVSLQAPHVSSCKRKATVSPEGFVSTINIKQKVLKTELVEEIETSSSSHHHSSVDSMNKHNDDDDDKDSVVPDSSVIAFRRGVPTSDDQIHETTVAKSVAETAGNMQDEENLTPSPSSSSRERDSMGSHHEEEQQLNPSSCVVKMEAKTSSAPGNKRTSPSSSENDIFLSLLREKNPTTKITKDCPLFRHKTKCCTVPLENPSSADFPDTSADSCMDMAPPNINGLMNFPACEKSLNNDFRSCVMCGKVCPTKRYSSRVSANSAIIPPQNKGVCTACDITIWVVIKTGLKVKWCKGCKNFQPWATFGVKPNATKCLRCRHQQRERYARKKEQAKMVSNSNE